MNYTLKKYKLKKKPLIILGTIIFFILILLFGINKYKTYIYHQTTEYKLLTRGYSQKEIDLLKKELDKASYERLIEEKKNNDLLNILGEKYYISANRQAYLDYQKRNKEKSPKEIISIVNVYAHNEFYEISFDTKLEDYTTIVNKFYRLPDSYAPSDIVNIATQYAYEGNSIRQIVYDSYKQMWSAALKDGHNLIVTSGYRSEESQKNIYNNYENSRGIEYADSIAARPSYSEHQTGLALDILVPGVKAADFQSTQSYQWLITNAHKYGFILRYPEGKENITGYTYESWHYRYLGEEIATAVYNEGITYDEYYAYYLNKN